MRYLLLGVFLLCSPAARAQTLSGGTFEMSKHGMGPVSAGDFSTEAGSFSFRGNARALASLQYPLYEAGGKALFPTPGGMLRYLQTMDNRMEQNGVIVSLSKNSIPEDFDFYINADPLAAPMRANAGAIAAANVKLPMTLGPQAALVPNGIVEFNLLADSGAFWDAALYRPASISLGYPDNDNDGIVDGTNPPVRVKTLGIYVLNEAHSLWVRMPGANVDSAAHSVAASIPHFSVYALIGTADQSVDTVYAYPVPWAPNSGDPLNGSLSGGITFTNLPSEGTITIYTLSGQIVQTLPISPSSPQLRWDVRTPGGRDVVSGVYLWRVQSGNNNKVGKLVVIR